MVTGIAPDDSATVAATIVDGDRQGSVVTFNNWEGPGAILAGLTIRNGIGTQVGAADSRSGGGIFCGWGVSPMIHHCQIRGNAASWDKHISPINEGGGGIFAGGGSRATISDCIIEGNHVFGMRGCGGGIMCANSAWLLLKRCRISNNRAMAEQGFGGRGGALDVRWCSSILTNCVISGNRAETSGGGILHNGIGGLQILNCILTDNQAREGAALYLSDCEHQLQNTTIANNRAAGSAGAISVGRVDSNAVILENCILWENGLDPVFRRDAEDPWPTITWSDVQHGYPGEGNIDEWPGFFRADGPWWAFALDVPSACMDAGDPAFLDPPWQRLWPRYARHNGPRLDMGAYGGVGAIGWLDRLPADQKE